MVTFFKDMCFCALGKGKLIFNEYQQLNLQRPKPNTPGNVCIKEKLWSVCVPIVYFEEQ
jgi:hypothetical protein